MSETILDEAKALVWGDRNDAYGHPYDDYQRTGIMWGAILQGWAKASAECSAPLPVPPELAALCMAAVKISREVNRPKRDNRVDLAGYAACVDRIQAKKEGQE